MCRRKGDTYRKWNTKKHIRIRCPGWTLREDTIEKIKTRSKELEISESRIVDIALQDFLSQSSSLSINPDKFFSKT